MTESMDRNAIEVKLLTVLSTLLKQPFASVAGLSRQNTPAWDSLKHVEIMFALEDELGLEFSDQELAGLDDAEKIIAAIEARHAS